MKMSIVDSEKLAVTLTPNEKDYQFGVDPVGICAQLRQIADAIEAKDVVIEKAVVYHVAKLDDYRMSAIVVHFCEKAFASPDYRHITCKPVEVPISEKQ